MTSSRSELLTERLRRRLCLSVPDRLFCLSSIVADSNQISYPLAFYCYCVLLCFNVMSHRVLRLHRNARQAWRAVNQIRSQLIQQKRPSTHSLASLPSSSSCSSSSTSSLSPSSHSVSIRSFTSSTHASSYSSPLKAYQGLVASGEIRLDTRQENAMKLLDDLHAQILQRWNNKQQFMSATPSVQSHKPAVTEPVSSGGMFGFAKKLFGNSKATTSTNAQANTASSQQETQVTPLTPFVGLRGLYMHGGVGCGKQASN